MLKDTSTKNLNLINFTVSTLNYYSLNLIFKTLLKHWTIYGK